MTMDMTPPPAVVEFAEKAGYEWGVDYIREWNGFKVYFPYLEPSINDLCDGLPQFILFKDDRIRWADDDERDDIMYLDNQEN